MAIFPDHAFEAAAIVKAADVAPYQAKRGGRNRVVMFEKKAEQIAFQHYTHLNVTEIVKKVG